MDLLDFAERCLNVVIFSNFAEVRGHGVLSGGDFYAIRFPSHRRREQALVRLEVFHAQSGAHNHQAKRIVLERGTCLSVLFTCFKVFFTLFVG